MANRQMTCCRGRGSGASACQKLRLFHINRRCSLLGFSPLLETDLRICPTYLPEIFLTSGFLQRPDTAIAGGPVFKLSRLCVDPWETSYSSTSNRPNARPE